MIAITSYGIRNGPFDANLEYSCLKLPNPHRDLNLRNHNGTERAVQEAVYGTKAETLLNQALHDINQLDHNQTTTVAFFCIGGRHRSVTLACLLYKELTSNGIPCTIRHRDI
jgi:UPF0042 nucleotide-binding protein